MWPEQGGRHLADDIFTSIFLKENVFLSYHVRLFLGFETGSCNGLVLDNRKAIAWTNDYTDVIMGEMVSQITSLTIVYSTVYSGADQRKHQSSASLAFVRGIYRGPVNSPHKWPVTRHFFPKNWWRHHVIWLVNPVIYTSHPQPHPRMEWVKAQLRRKPDSTQIFRNQFSVRPLETSKFSLIQLYSTVINKIILDLNSYKGCCIWNNVKYIIYDTRCTTAEGLNINVVANDTSRYLCY